MSNGSEKHLDYVSINRIKSDAKIVLGNRCPEDKKFLYERVGKLIEYVTGRINYFENARSRIFTASATLLGFGVTVLTFGIDYLADAPWLWSVLILIAAAILSMAIHLWQSGRSYSFRNVVQSPWYYIRNIPMFEDHKGYHKVKKAFDQDVAKNYARMAERHLAVALEKDVEQLVLLYAILAHKENDVRLTTHVIERGLGIFIVFLIGIFVVNLAMPLP